MLVCNPRRNALLKEGSKSDKVDARKLADLLRTGMLRPVYHGENGLRTLRELGRSYQTIGKDLTRVMNRLKAVYRGWGIPCAGTRVYAARYREEWLSKLPQAGVRRRAELLYQQLDGLQALRPEVRPEFLAESRKHKAAKLPCESRIVQLGAGASQRYRICEGADRDDVVLVDAQSRKNRSEGTGGDHSGHCGTG